jgi:hypothetical protein
MLNFVENLLENERDPRSGPMNYQDHSLSLSDPDRSLVLSHFLTNFLQNLASCHTAFIQREGTKLPEIFTSNIPTLINYCGSKMSLSKFEEGGENYSDNFRKVELITAIILGPY